MKKIKTQKGITLIALIITIIILLILAVVTIGSIKESKILGHAQNAAKDYNKAQTEEKGILDSYEELIEDNIDSEFKKFVISTVASSEKITGDYYNILAIRNIIKQEYPTALAEISMLGLGLGTGFSSITAEQFEEDMLSLNAQGETEIIEAFNLTLHYEKDLLVLDIKGILEEYNGSIVPMKESEAEKLFTYRATTTSEITNAKENYITITGYLGTDTTVKIPAVLYDENGNVTKIVAGIGEAAFCNGVKTLYISLLGMSEENYKSKTINEIWETLFDETYTGTSVSSDSTDLADKKTAMIEAFDSMGVGKNMYEFDENDMLYVWIGYNGEVVPKPVDMEEAYIPFYVEYIGEKAFAYQTKLTKVYVGTSDIDVIKSNAFSGCTSLTDIYVYANKNTLEELVGYDTKWGAPESAKLYYVNDYETTLGREYDKSVYIEYTE